MFRKESAINPYCQVARTPWVMEWLSRELENQRPTLDKNINQLLARIGRQFFQTEDLKTVDAGENTGEESVADAGTKSKGSAFLSALTVDLLAKTLLEAYDDNKDKISAEKVVAALHNAVESSDNNDDPEKKGKKGKKGNKVSCISALEMKGRDPLERLMRNFIQKIEDRFGCLLPGDAAAIAFHGRFVALFPDMYIESAVLFAPAISTHEVSPETDFITVKNEDPAEFITNRGLVPQEQRGSSFMDDQQYHPGHTRIETRVIDPDLAFKNFRTNPSGTPLTVDEKKMILREYLLCVIFAQPTAKMHTHLSFEFPRFVHAYLCEGQAVTLAAAFENQAKSDGNGFEEPSIAKLRTYWSNVKRNLLGLGKFDGVKLCRFPKLVDGKPVVAPDGTTETREEYQLDLNDANTNLGQMLDEIVNFVIS
jgi:hypothetical protein